MPPKGWRKYGDSTQFPKDAELVSIDEILFPRSTVQKLAKGILNAADETSENGLGDNMGLTKDSLVAVQRSATVFVSHILFYARQTARDFGRKNVNSQDILTALERADLAGFAPEIKHKLSTFESDVEAKKKLKAEAKEAAPVEGPVPKKMRDNASNRVLKTGAEEEETEDDDDDIEDAEEDMERSEIRNEDATILPANDEPEDEEE
ncbi:histone-fold-containing protein, partial [Metschnikowia bicuspidata var. bicuspidata NRRL YB-4993]